MQKYRKVCENLKKAIDKQKRREYDKSIIIIFKNKSAFAKLKGRFVAGLSLI